MFALFVIQHSHDDQEPHCGGKRSSLATFLQVPPPHATVEKPFLLGDGQVELEASLNKAIYAHGEDIKVSIQVRNLSSKTVRRIKVGIYPFVYLLQGRSDNCLYICFYYLKINRIGYITKNISIIRVLSSLKRTSK